MSFRRRTGLFLFLTVLFQLALMWLLRDIPARQNVLVLQGTFSGEDFRALLESWSAEQKALILSHYWLDFIYPVCYSAFLYFLLSDLKTKKPWPGLAWVAGACDYLENILHILLIKAVLPPEDGWVLAAGLFASAKWLLILVLSLLAAYKLIRNSRRKWLKTQD